MKRFVLYGLLLSFFFSSCLKKEVYNGNEDDQNDLDLSFKFEMRTEKNLSLSATDGEGRPGAEVLFGVYATQPYTEEGCISGVTPLYIGYTDASGRLNDKISVPANVAELYVVPLTAGYGVMQRVAVADNITLNFKGVAFQEYAAPKLASKAGEDVVQSCEFTRISNLYHIYVPYRSTEVGDNGIPLVGSSQLISQETVSAQLVNLINSWYPEAQNVVTADLKKSPDLIVTDENGAEVWVTYIGDGGFSVNNQTVYNTLVYYNYQEGELTGRDDLGDLHMTLVLPNTQQRQCPQGLKVQLLYWDGQEYHTVFPKGTRIGFAVARKGFANNGKAITEKEAYQFKNRDFPNATGNPEGFYYSTPVLNVTSMTQAIIRSSSEYNCCIMGFDIRRTDDPKSDFDFNDVLMTVTSSPVAAVEPEEDIPVIEEVVPSQYTYGTLAFEDQWPIQGDYDFNDFVVNYAYGLVKDTDNRITHVRMSFTPVAKGAAAYTQIGFGIELPLSPAAVESGELQGGVLEAGNERATVIVWENVNTAFGQNGGFLNTEAGGELYTYEETVINLPLKTPVDNLSLEFNPFIFVNGRSHEIHLVDHQPTSKMDYNLFDSGDDRSKPEENVYFRMDNYYPWVLDFPRNAADAPAWRYPKERVNIAEAYLNYKKWVTNKTDLSWFDASISGNVNEENLY